MVGQGRRSGRSAIAAQIGADNSEANLDEKRRHPVPRGVRSRMPVQQDDRGALTTAADPQPHFRRELDRLELEAVEHHLILLYEAPG